MKKLKNLFCLSSKDLAERLCLRASATDEIDEGVGDEVVESVDGEITESRDENLSFGCFILDKMKRDPYYKPNANVKGLWGSSGHKETIQHAADAVGTLSSSEITLISKISNLADTDYPASKGYTCLHSNWNYVLSLKYLWTFAKKIQNSTATTISAQVKEAESAARKIALSNANNNSKDELKYFNNLVSATSSMVKSQGKGFVNKPKQRRNIVFGFIFHLLGDLYAHNTVVPKYTISGTTYKTSKTITSKDANLAKSDFNDWNGLKSLIKAEDIAFTGLQNKHRLPKTQSEKNDKSYVSKQQKYLRGRYEDNTSFCKERFEDAKDACEFFIVNYSSGFSLATIQPVYGLKLHQFYTWASRTGYSNYYSKSKWKKISNGI